jgi:hypothetical protein
MIDERTMRFAFNLWNAARKGRVVMISFASEISRRDRSYPGDARALVDESIVAHTEARFSGVAILDGSDVLASMSEQLSSLEEFEIETRCASAVKQGVTFEFAERMMLIWGEAASAAQQRDKNR